MPRWTLFALGSASFAGLTAIFAKLGVKDMPSDLATFWRVAVLLPCLAALVWFRGEWRPLSGVPPWGLFFLALSAFATGLSWLCYFRALQLGPASLVGSVDKLSLLVTVVLAVIFLGERLSGRQWTGAALMLIATWLLARR